MFEEIVVTNVANWKEEVLESKELVLVMFWHEQCAYCRMSARVFTAETRFARAIIKVLALALCCKTQPRDRLIKS